MLQTDTNAKRAIPDRGLRTHRTFMLLVCALLLGAGIAATSCYAAQQPPPKPTNAECLACHNDSTMSKEEGGKQVSLYVNEDHFKASIHSMFNCVDCHTDVKTSPHDVTPVRLTCAQCHADQQAAYERSFHAQALKNGDGHAATCADCHGSPHELLPASDPKSRVSHVNIAATCGTCHGQQFVMAISGHSAQPFYSYEQSVHGKAVAAGSQRAAVCTDCHGTHEILAAGDPKSSIFKFNVPATCAKCHKDVQQEFAQSIHGKAVQRGNWQAPVCTDCHGIHSIKAHKDPESSVAAGNLSRVTCARCHEGVRLTQELGIPGARTTTYLQSYHGLASKLGSPIVANCASCHGVHNILPSSDPRSTINQDNLIKTCGQCHQGVSGKFILGKVHVDAPLSADVGSVAVRWIRRFYLSMIFAVIGGMVLHNLIIWRRKAASRRKVEHRLVTRMSSQQRVQHLTLLASFITLVVTGFALKYPDSWFSALLAMNEQFRSIAHRVAGVILITIGVYHIFYVAFTREGRRLLRDFFPAPKDATDVWTTMRYYLGISTIKPEFGRFSYAEKAEYWALVWGLIVMAASGIMLWARVVFGNLLPRWWLDIATAVHFYEAILATLAIIAWHFYQVFFDPDVYPMNWAWWDGKMSFEHYREEHALDSDTLLESARAEEAAEPVEVAEITPQPAVAPKAAPEEEVGEQTVGADHK
jgi:cytochrome b subunit of formate dehydrogenase